MSRFQYQQERQAKEIISRYSMEEVGSLLRVSKPAKKSREIFTVEYDIDPRYKNRGTSKIKEDLNSVFLICINNPTQEFYVGSSRNLEHRLIRLVHEIHSEQSNSESSIRDAVFSSKSATIYALDVDSEAESHKVVKEIKADFTPGLNR